MSSRHNIADITSGEGVHSVEELLQLHSIGHKVLHPWHSCYHVPCFFMSPVDAIGLLDKRLGILGQLRGPHLHKQLDIWRRM